MILCCDRYISTKISGRHRTTRRQNQLPPLPQPESPNTQLARLKQRLSQVVDYVNAALAAMTAQQLYNSATTMNPNHVQIGLSPTLSFPLVRPQAPLQPQVPPPQASGEGDKNVNWTKELDFAFHETEVRNKGREKRKKYESGESSKGKRIEKSRRYA